MDILKNTITVKKDQFEENVYKGMNRSLEDAYNILLSRFENQTEVSYYSELSILLTNSDGEHVAKTPMGMYDTLLIDNDMKEILEVIDKYNNGE